MTAILGISAFYHDSAAALVVDGKILAAVQEERLSRLKHDDRFPRLAIDACLEIAGLGPEAIDYVVFYEKPLRKFERLMMTAMGVAPLGYASFRQFIPRWLKDKLHTPHRIRHGLGEAFEGQLVFVDHHESHAASAFYPSPFEEAAILTVDGVGEWSTTCIGRGQGARLELLDELRFPHSLGLLYAAFTAYTGFRINSGEYKLMGLAPYGQPVYAEVILKQMIDLKDDGSFRLNMKYFNYGGGLTMTTRAFHRLLGGPPRVPETELRQRDMDLAASIQQVTEEIMLRLVRQAHLRTGMKHLVMAGGVALNCVANGRLMREGPFESIWIQPAAGDAGGALGAPLFLWHQLLEKPRQVDPRDTQHGSFLGLAFSDEEIERELSSLGAVFSSFSDEAALCDKVAELIANQWVVGWFQGRMEFGPRALGGRSILGDARSPTMQSTMNQKIKFRESFRPFAPIVLQEWAPEIFDVPDDFESPYMLLVASVRGLEQEPPASKKAKSPFPAVTHVDGSSRLQTIDARRHPRLHQLLIAFHRRTGCPLMINTSFNVRGEPIVGTPADAYRCFRLTDMDAVVIGRHLLLKRDQTAPFDRESRQAYLGSFPLD